ncbi:MFS transporter [Bosea sp. BK604]|uniref:MFS transporter n=1 Tax=Bosea sp. BK604 TaxID=2512180 RepID=UPI0010D3546E|nr:MFS transporter [Bosea sp. BK604]TCR64847.1 DHA2 family multidrug resistance protein-like MFS transporter [Bosea sp. BK604]
MMELDQPARAGRREWIGLAVIALPCLLYSMDLTVLNLAVPQLSAELRPSAAQLLWIVDIYGFMIAGCLITMGTLGDRIGRRKLLLIGAVAFGLASIVAAFANTAPLLIAARAVLGVAGATLAPSTLSLIRNMFLDPRERTVAIGIWIASFSAGGAIGPLVGGAMLEHFWWGSVFLINVPVMVLLLALGPFLLPEFKDPDAGKLDLPSAALSLAAVLAVIYGLKHVAVDGLGWEPVLMTLAGLALALLFLVRQIRLAEPLIDLSIFRVKAFSAALTVNVLGFFIAFSSFLFIGQYLQLVLGMGPLEAGLWSLPSAFGFIIGSILAPRILSSLKPAQVMAGGFALTALGFAVLSGIARFDGPLVVVAGLLLLSLGLAPVVTLTTDLAVGTVPPERAGMASGLSETSSEFGGALGIAVLGSVLSMLYRHQLGASVPADVPTEAAAAARDTLGAALTIAHDMGPAGEALLAAARDAFTRSLSLTAAVSAVLACATGLVAFLALRNIGDGSDNDGAAERLPAPAAK